MYLDICKAFSKKAYSLIHHFETVPNSKKLQATAQMWLIKDIKIQIANLVEQEDHDGPILLTRVLSSTG